MRRYRLGCMVVGLAAGCQSAVTVHPPGPPASGPGGADYAHGEVFSQRFGVGADEYWVFSPDDPRPVEAPVVVFLHGWGAMSPRVYGAWIRHTVRKGRVVIYPQYQADLVTPADQMPGAALGAVQAALARLAAEGPVRAREGGIAWVGHSLGGTIGTILAATAEDNALPTTAALMAVEPGGETHLALPDLSGLPSEVLVLLVVGDRDAVAEDVMARSIRAAISHMPYGNVDLVTVRSEDRTIPALVANHFAPLATIAGFPPAVGSEGEAGKQGWLAARRQTRQAEQFAPDALDYYAFWKLSDGLLDAAFLGVHREYALGATTRQRFMGVASDGVAVPQLVIERGAGE